MIIDRYTPLIEDGKPIMFKELAGEWTQYKHVKVLQDKLVELWGALHKTEESLSKIRAELREKLW